MKITRDGFGFWCCEDEHLCDICEKDCKVATRGVTCNAFKAKGAENNDGKERKE